MLATYVALAFTTVISAEPVAAGSTLLCVDATTQAASVPSRLGTGVLHFMNHLERSLHLSREELYRIYIGITR